MTVFEKYALAATIFFALLIVAFNLITSPADRLVTVTVLDASSPADPPADVEQGEQGTGSGRLAAESSAGAVLSVIPREPEKDPDLADGGEAQDTLVNINTATAEELDALPGIGPVLAGRIVAYRERNGRFATAEALKNVSGIGSKTYEKLAAYVTVD